MFICIQKGVYRHAIVGCSESLETARGLAKGAIQNEPDHYHDVEIVEIQLDSSLDETLIETWEAVMPAGRTGWMQPRQLLDIICVK